MTDLLSDLNVYILAWLKSLYFVIIFAFFCLIIDCDIWVFFLEFLSLFSDKSESWFFSS